MPKVIINANIAMALTGCTGEQYGKGPSAADQVSQLVEKLHECGVEPVADNAVTQNVPQSGGPSREIS